MLSPSLKRKLVGFASFFFVFFLLIDPSNSIFRLKIPAFALFIGSLAIAYKPSMKHLWIIISLLLVHFVSSILGMLGDYEIDPQIQRQYFLFIILLISLFWSKNINIKNAISISCLVVSVLSIIGFVSMQFYPLLEESLYMFSEAHDQPFFMARRNIMGLEITSFMFRTLPVTMIPAAYHYDQFLFEKKKRFLNLLQTIIYLVAIICGGLRTMFLGVFVILMFMTYPKIKRYKIVQFFTIILVLVGFYVAYLAITDSDSESSGIKFGHLLSYMDLIGEHWEYLIFGMGPGAMFYSKGVGQLIPLTEWTYFEIFRMYGIVGLIFFAYLLLIPLVKHNNRKFPIKNWRSISLGYLFYLVSCMSNPYLIGSTGLICIIFIYSIVDNPIFREKRPL